MKYLVRRFCLTLIFIICISTLQAQVIKEEKRNMSMGYHNALVMEMPEADDRLAEKVWKDFIKQYGGKTKKNRRENEWETERVQIVGLGSTDPLWVHARIAEYGNGSSIAVWFNNSGSYISSNTDTASYRRAVELLQDFAVEVRIANLEELLEAEEKALSRLEKDLDGLKKDNKNYHEEIEECKERIREMETNIKENIKDQEVSEQSIQLQKEVVEEILDRIKKARNEG